MKILPTPKWIEKFIGGIDLLPNPLRSYYLAERFSNVNNIHNIYREF